MTSLRGARYVPDWTRPGARWTAWMCWAALCLNLLLLVWRGAEGRPGKAVFPGVMVAVFCGLLIANRVHRAHRAERAEQGRRTERP
ncbi:hypothetical protein [Streptomyces galbus]|uniref:DUF2530 domain-containing protein n=1 Tax=Streptomyces galbus TaxID=33898 RepID=A0ABX1IE14_STRGB|nr:hypothetical protein [Streptomyces galbus]NKQ23904.1 hypothetical protein [Streptomyces galbus]